MIEAIVIKYLNDKLSVPVFMEMPEEKVTSFVMAERTGGATENHINYATFAIQSYAETLEKTILLNEEVKNAMDNIIELDSVFRSKRNSDYNFTDTIKKRYRYQAVYDLVY